MWNKQKDCSGQRECGASKELKFGKATRVTGVMLSYAGPYTCYLGVSKIRMY